jgi:hypothetical protein
VNFLNRYHYLSTQTGGKQGTEQGGRIKEDRAAEKSQGIILGLLYLCLGKGQEKEEWAAREAGTLEQGFSTGNC